MTRKEYCDTVMRCLQHLSPGEKAAVWEEIEAHIEDHICDLLELGYDGALAEERTMALMGNPEEVGRELDKHYTSRIWYVLERAALILLIVLFFQVVTGFGILFHARDSIMTRVDPDYDYENDFGADARIETDLRVTVGNDVLRVFSVSVGERTIYFSGKEPETARVAQVSMCTYDRIPGGVVSENIDDGLTLKNQRGELLDPSDAGWHSTGSWGAEHINRYVHIQPEDTYVTLLYDHFGEVLAMEIPLPEVTP